MHLIRSGFKVPTHIPADAKRCKLTPKYDRLPARNLPTPASALRPCTSSGCNPLSSIDRFMTAHWLSCCLVMPTPLSHTDRIPEVRLLLSSIVTVMLRCGLFGACCTARRELSMSSASAKGKGDLPCVCRTRAYFSPGWNSRIMWLHLLHLSIAACSGEGIRSYAHRLCCLNNVKPLPAWLLTSCICFS